MAGMMRHGRVCHGRVPHVRVPHVRAPPVRAPPVRVHRPSMMPVHRARHGRAAGCTPRLPWTSAERPLLDYPLPFTADRLRSVIDSFIDSLLTVIADYLVPSPKSPFTLESSLITVRQKAP